LSVPKANIYDEQHPRREIDPVMTALEEVKVFYIDWDAGARHMATS
jgi:hypothetical protein